MPDRARNQERKGFSQTTRLRLLELDADRAERRIDRNEIALYGTDGRGGLVGDVTILKVRVAAYGALGSLIGGGTVALLAALLH